MDEYFRKTKHRSAVRRPIPNVSAAALRDRVGVATPAAPQPSIRPPRKRFRKKVTGLFGEQTDLQRRMQKLLREMPKDMLLSKGLADGDMPISEQGPQSVNLVLAKQDNLASVKTVVARIDAISQRTKSHPDEQKDHSDCNSEKIVTNRPNSSECGEEQVDNQHTMRESIGRLSPRSNEIFLSQLRGGDDVQAPNSSSGATNGENTVIRPELPKLFDPSIGSPVLSPVRASVDRTATPAMLRRKVRRTERGYRSADVLRVRLQASESKQASSTHSVSTQFPRALGLERYAVSGVKRSRGTEVDVEEPGRRVRAKQTREKEAETIRYPFELLIQAVETERHNSAQRDAGDGNSDTISATKPSKVSRKSVYASRALQNRESATAANGRSRGSAKMSTDNNAGQSTIALRKSRRHGQTEKDDKLINDRNCN